MESYRVASIILEIVHGDRGLGAHPDSFEKQLQEQLAEPFAATIRYDVEPDVRRSLGVDFVMDMAEELTGLHVLNVVVGLL
jgi:hypothetical protein